MQRIIYRKRWMETLPSAKMKIIYCRSKFSQLKWFGLYTYARRGPVCSLNAEFHRQNGWGGANHFGNIWIVLRPEVTDVLDVERERTKQNTKNINVENCIVSGWICTRTCICTETCVQWRPAWTRIVCNDNAMHCDLKIKEQIIVGVFL